jgi:hypothetical protein
LRNQAVSFLGLKSICFPEIRSSELSERRKDARQERCSEGHCVRDLEVRRNAMYKERSGGPGYIEFLRRMYPWNRYVAK